MASSSYCKKKKIKLEQVEDDLCLPFLFDLPLPSSLQYIETLPQCQACFQNLNQFNILVIGIDTETEPIIGHKTSLLQLAIRYTQNSTEATIHEMVYIFDLLQLSLQDSELFYCNQIFSLFCLKKSVVKIVHGLTQDVMELLASYPSLTHLQVICEILETNSLHQKLNPHITSPVSLKYLTRQYLHSNLIKLHQCSSWGTRPLTSGQLNYAACDALVLLRLYDAMCFEIEDIFPGCDLQECMTSIDLTNEQACNSPKKIFRPIHSLSPSLSLSPTRLSPSIIPAISPSPPHPQSTSFDENLNVNKTLPTRNHKKRRKVLPSSEGEERHKSSRSES